MVGLLHWQDEDPEEDDEDDKDEDKRLAAEAAAASAPWNSSGGVALKGAGSGSSSPKSINEEAEDDDVLSVGSEETSTTLSSRVDVDTIERDVLRCTTHLLPPALLPHVHDNRVKALLRNQQERLAHLINKVLIHHDTFWYYQGYHDVSSVFLSTLGGKVSLRKEWQLDGDDTLSFEVLSQVSRQYYADFLHHNFGHLQTTLKLTVFPLLARFDSELHELLYQLEIPCSFCLSWVLTWFSRESGPHTHRVFDACLASHPLFALYLSVSMITHPYNRNLLLTSEPDFPVLHHVLRTLPQHTFGARSDDDNDPDWMNDDGDDASSIWDSRTVDEAWLRQKMDEANTITTTTPTTASTSSAGGSVLPSSQYSSSATTPRHQHHHPVVLPVPMEEIIDRALEYMRLVPPHQLLELAERYYRIYYGTAHGGPAAGIPPDLLSDVPEIHFFQSATTTTTTRPPPPVSVHSRAYIAGGYAEGSSKTRQKRLLQRRKRRAIAAVTAAFALILVIVRTKWNNHHNPLQESVTTSPPPPPHLSPATTDTYPDAQPSSSSFPTPVVPLSIHERHRLDGYDEEGGSADTEAYEDTEL